jgi:hypothetical protein
MDGVNYLVCTPRAPGLEMEIEFASMPPAGSARQEQLADYHRQDHSRPTASSLTHMFPSPFKTIVQRSNIS